MDGDARPFSPLLREIFDRMPAGVAVFDRELRVVEWNTSFARFLEDHRPDLGAALAPGAPLSAVSPWDMSIVEPLFRKALNGETVTRDASPYHGETGTTYWDIVLSPLYEGGEIVRVARALEVDVVGADRQILEGEAARGVGDRADDALVGQGDRRGDTGEPGAGVAIAYLPGDRAHLEDRADPVDSLAAVVAHERLRRRVGVGIEPVARTARHSNEGARRKARGESRSEAPRANYLTLHHALDASIRAQAMEDKHRHRHASTAKTNENKGMWALVGRCGCLSYN